MRKVELIAVLLLALVLASCAAIPSMDRDVAESLVHLDKMVVRVVKVVVGLRLR